MSLFRLATPGIKRRTYPLGQLLIQAGILVEAISIHLLAANTIYVSRFVFAMSAFAPVEISYSDM